MNRATEAPISCESLLLMMTMKNKKKTAEMANTRACPENSFQAGIKDAKRSE